MALGMRAAVALVNSMHNLTVVAHERFEAPFSRLRLLPRDGLKESLGVKRLRRRRRQQQQQQQ